MAASTGTRGFDAFISYNRAADAKVAVAVQRGLQRFAKPWYRARALRVFRDDESLSADPSLWSSIARGLDESRFFILLASPESAASPWVPREVDYWCRDESRRSKLVIALTGGEIEWDDAANEFDWSRTTALPHAVEGVFSDEPRHVDLRWARSAESLSLSYPGFREAIADLAAPLHGVPKDVLASAEVRQHRRTLRTAWAAVALVSLLAVAASLFGLSARAQGRKVQQQLRVAESTQLAGQALTDYRGPLDRGLLLAMAAYDIAKTHDARAALTRGADATRSVIGYLRGHSRPVKALAFAPDGRTLVSGGDDGVVNVWDARSGARLRELRRRGSGIDSIAVAPANHFFGTNGLLVAYATADGYVGVVSLDGRSAVRIRLSSYPIRALALTATGDSMAVATTEGLVLLRLLPAGRFRRVVIRDNVPNLASIAFGPTASSIAAGTEHGDVVIWDLSARHLRRLKSGVDASLTGIAFRPGAAKVAATTLAGQQTRLIVWNLAAPSTAPGETLLHGRGSLEGPVFSRDGRRIAVGTSTGIVDFLSLEGRLSIVKLGGHVGQVTCLALSPDGTTLASGGADATVVLRDETGGQREQVLLGASRDSGAAGEVTSVAFARNGTLASGSNDSSLSIWRTWRTLHGQPPANYVRSPFPSAVRAIALAPGGNKLAAAGGGGAVTVWNTQSGGGRPVVVPADGTVDTVAFSPDADTVAWGSSNGEIQLWSVQGRKIVGRIDIRHGAVHDIAFSPDGAAIAVADDDGTVAIVRTTTMKLDGAPVQRHVGPVLTLSFSPTGDRLASGGTDDEVVVSPGHDGRESGTPLLLHGHHAEVRTVAYSPDGTTLVTADSDGQLILYEGATGRIIGSPIGLATQLQSAAVSPDGAAIAFTAGNRVRTVYALPLTASAAATRELLCRVAGRTLTRSEWAEFLPAERYRSICPG